MEEPGEDAGPLISVIVTNYNYGPFLRQAIESALSQDYPRVEVVVVDDGSTDDSRSVIASFGASITAIFKENGGSISSLNRGWEAARGEIIVVLDADDFLLPGALAVHAAALRHEGVVRSQGYQRIVNDAGRPTGGRYPSQRPQDEGLQEIVLSFGPSGYFSTATSGNAWAGSLFEKVFPLPESRLVGGDALLFDVAPLYGRTVTTEVEVASYRMHGQSLSQGKAGFNLKNISTILDVYDLRANRLVDTARSLSMNPLVEQWRAGNWRIATLRYLRARLGDGRGAPSLREHLATANGCRSRKKAAVVFLAILVIRMAPHRLSLAAASRLIDLKQM